MIPIQSSTRSIEEKRPIAAPPPTPTVLVFCCVCLSLFGVCRDRIEAFGAFRVTDWAAGSG